MPTTPGKSRKRRSTSLLASKTLSIRDEIRSVGLACDTAARQLKDDVLLSDAEHAMRELQPTVENFGHLWLCGNGPGFCLAVEMAYRLMTPSNRYESQTRATVLNANGAINSTSYGKAGSNESMAAELAALGRKGDALWCFASDPTSRNLLGVATKAYRELKIPVVVFTSYPGTPIIRFSHAKLRIKEAEDHDVSGYCVQWAHHFIATIICNQLKRVAKAARG